MIGKTRSNIEAELDFFYGSYKNLIDRIATSYEQDKNLLKGKVGLIKSDKSIDFEESRSILSPYYDLEEELLLQEQNIRICLFASVFSFWEKSLLQIYNHRGCKIYKKDGSENKSLKIKDYIDALLAEDIKVQLPSILTNQLDELRNYCMHGTLTEQRTAIIKELMESESFNLIEIEEKFYFSTYDGLFKTLDIIYDTLKFILN